MDYSFLQSDGQKFYDNPDTFPQAVQFIMSYVDEDDRNYIQMDLDGILQESERLVLPSGTFYITNDEDRGLFYKVESTTSITKRELAIHIFEWLQLRNAYFNVAIALQRKNDITGKCSECADNLSVHGIHKSKNMRNGYPVYNMNISS